MVEMRQCILPCVYTGNGLCSVEGNSRSERPADSVEKDKTNVLPIHMVWYFNESGRQRKGQNNFNVVILLSSDTLQSQIYF